MKTKIIITLFTLLGLSINVASAGKGSASLGYTSDYFFRGALVSEEAVQSSINYSAEVGGFNSSVSAFTNQSVSGGSDAYILGGQLSRNLCEFATLNLGLEHTEFVSGSAILDARLGVDFQTLLSPSLVVERNLDQSLYTFEASVGHQLDLKEAALNLSALYGNTDQGASANVDYYVLGASLERPISDNASAELGVDYVDSDTIEGESIFSLSVNVKF